MNKISWLRRSISKVFWKKILLWRNLQKRERAREDANMMWILCSASSSIRRNKQTNKNKESFIFISDVIVGVVVHVKISLNKFVAKGWLCIFDEDSVWMISDVKCGKNLENEKNEFFQFFFISLDLDPDPGSTKCDVTRIGNPEKSSDPKRKWRWEFFSILQNGLT